jgi:putative zinc finger protein
VTCHEARELFSALADDVLVSGDHVELDTHLAGCAECRWEWTRFRSTVALLESLPAERAPAGFVDRVVERARPRPWYRRLAREVFVPLPRKLPVHAAAVVLVAGLAVWVFQRTSDQRQAARLEDDRGVTTVTAPPRAPAGGTGETLLSRVPGEGERAPANVASKDERPEPSAPGTARGAPERAAPPSSDAPHARERRLQDEQPADGTRAPAQAPADAARARDAAPPEAARAMQRSGASPALRAARVPPAPIAARLAVADVDAALRASTSLVTRLGGSHTIGAPTGNAVVVDIVVPDGAYPELRRELARLGSLQTDREPEQTAGASVAVRLSIAPGAP